jgi:hypothetical protein
MKDELLNQINLSDEEKSILYLVREKGDVVLNEFVHNFYLQNHHLPMFWILEQQLIENENRDIEILINTFPIFQKKKQLTLDEVAEKQALSRERVRQIRNNAFHETFEITDEVIECKKDSDFIKYIDLLQRKDDWVYFLDYIENNGCITHNDDRIHYLLKKEQSSLSSQFVLQVIANVYMEKYCLIGGFEVCERKKTCKNTFLIKKEFLDVFDFEKLIVEFKNHLESNNAEYNLNIDDYISNSSCWISAVDLNKFDCIVSVVKDVLLYEFHLYSNSDGLITIPATKEKSPSDVIYEILKQNRNPMHLNDIFAEFKKVLPEHKYTEPAQLRSWLQRHDAITHRNRSSIYTLKEWNHIKTGTIRDAIVEFLLKNDLPQTADDITEYVLQYFPKTNIASIRTTMYNDTKKRFAYFNANLFGLANKHYSAEYEIIKPQEIQRKSFEQRLYDLEKFLSENDHFPFSTSDNEEEVALYRWWRINRDIKKLTDQQRKEIERINNQYAEVEIDKTTYDWFLNCNNFKLFVLENRRLPSASGTEKFLYGWFRRTKNDFANNKLTEKQRAKYIELCKII